MRVEKRSIAAIRGYWLKRNDSSLIPVDPETQQDEREIMSSSKNKKPRFAARELYSEIEKLKKANGELRRSLMSGRKGVAGMREAVRRTKTLLARQSELLEAD